MKRNCSFKQGVVKTTSHPNLLYGQIVYIVEEIGHRYKVKAFNSSFVEEIEKKFLFLS
jgi:hypothetical protein